MVVSGFLLKIVQTPDSMIKVARQKNLEKNKSEQQIKLVHKKADSPEKEYGGRKGKEPTRYGDWEKNGRCIDF